MINLKNKSTLLALLLTFGGLVTSCNSGADELPTIDSEKLVTVKTKATFGSSSTASSSARTLSVVTLSEFVASIGNIELKIDDSDERSATDSIYTELEFKGPFVVDLLADSMANQLASVDIPVGIYDELEFKVIPNTDLDGKSLIINGEIDGVPFAFWTDEKEGFEINFSNNGGDLVLGEVGSVITINFDLDAIFGAGGAIDLTSAQDGNGDGLIEIYPGDPDGNEVLSYEILSQLEKATKLDEDEDLDEDGKGNDEDDDIDGDGKKNDEDEDDDNDGTNDDEDDDDDNDGKSDDDEDDDDHDDDKNHEEDDDDDDHEDDQQDAAITAMLTAGNWSITSFTNAADSYSAYTFTFEKEKVFAEDSTGVTEGEWEALTNTDSPMLLLEFEHAPDLLDNLDKAWKITSMDDTRFELVKKIDGEEVVVVFEKF